MHNLACIKYIVNWVILDIGVNLDAINLLIAMISKHFKVSKKKL